MSRPIIEIRGVSKVYQLGRIGFTSLRSELERWFRKKDARAQDGAGEFWALRDVSFEVARGEVVGIIGRNGAGKSTLLKILSEITEPTAGEIALRGRTASLLEIGTGFHPELSGRENVFLNGAILGMRRAEIARKFDEIVAFAEIEKFIDTPVKRYSSGMYVRLAFAVAAHLEPDILIVDEVLAVGDQSFQQKCLGKMQAVARNDGRTVLFVSHNMAAVSRLCDQAVHLESGRIVNRGPAQEVVAAYLQRATAVTGEWRRPSDRPLHKRVSFLHAAVLDERGRVAGVLPHSADVRVRLECAERDVTANWLLRISIYDRHGNELLCTHDSEAAIQRQARAGGVLRADCALPRGLLRPGLYSIGVSACEAAGDAPVALYEEHEPLLTFEISEQGYGGRTSRGLLGVPAQWSFHWSA